mmetsp:Transcript_25324/g.59075  ORF Transcript_25324/g.59075 Transcript_25324/m.59075 type:complete len:201 (-) Transcript_25324:390-992(-)
MSSETARTRKEARCMGALGLSMAKSSMRSSSASKPSTTCAGVSGLSSSSERSWQASSLSKSRRSSDSSTAARTSSWPRSAGRPSSESRRRTSSQSRELRYSSTTGRSSARSALGSMRACGRSESRPSTKASIFATRGAARSSSGHLSMSCRVSRPSSTASARKCAISKHAVGVSRQMSSNDCASASKPEATCAEVRMART